ncbi:BTB/POZ domain-containing protein [Cladophialophora immunda]|nr:BTB/POZ domain-containing protein [Cladophialophora immunda]
MAPTSESELILVDTDGDLILKVGSERGAAEESDTSSSQSSNDGPEAATQEVVENEQPSTLRIRVCSKFMTMCSPVFKAMLNGSFREGQVPLSSLEPPTLELPEDDPQSMVELCKILHHKWDTNLEAFPSCVLPLARAADKYDCTTIIRVWFNHQFLGEVSRGRKYSRLEIAQLISISYILDEAAAFYYFSAEALYRWRIKKNENDDFNSEILRNDLPPKIHEFLEKMANAELGELITSSHSVICNPGHGRLYDNPSRTHSTIYTLTRSANIPEVCPRHAQRVAQYVEALDEFNLWTPGPGRGGPVSLEEAICIIRQIAKAIANDESPQCSAQQCFQCQQEWDQTVWENIDDFEHQLPGLCLVCLNRGIFHSSPSMNTESMTECTAHFMGLGLNWNVDWHRDTRNYETLGD